MKKELEKFKKFKWKMSWTFGIALVFILLVVGLVFLFFQNSDRELEIDAKIEQVLIDENGENVFIKLRGGIDNGEIEELSLFLKMRKRMNMFMKLPTVQVRFLFL